jgi:DNA ligase-1
LIKAKLWDKSDLKGAWEATLKLDGVRVLFTEDGPISRKGKPLYNIPTNHSLVDCEVFTGSFKETITAVRTINSNTVPLSNLYSLDPIDSRLKLGILTDPTVEEITTLLSKVNSEGHEGLVLRKDSTWLKVKPEETFDVQVTGLVEGTGKYVGKLGAMLTPMGKVGTGFTDQERQDFWSNSIISETIEVSCMELTEDGKFRHPRFVRVRYDK